MLKLNQGLVRLEGVRRRDFLRLGALAGLGLSLPAWSAAKAAAATAGEPSKDVNCILIWTRGGTSHIDTFDPKPAAPADIRGDFSPIRTSVPGVHFTEVVPRWPRHTFRNAQLEPGQRGAWRRGSKPSCPEHALDQTTIAYPCYGSVLARRSFKRKCRRSCK